MGQPGARAPARRKSDANPASMDPIMSAARPLRCALLALALAFAGPAAAENAPPVAGLDIVFSVRARGITAGEFDFGVDFRDGGYEVRAARRITGLARALLGSRQDYRYSARGAIVGGELRPVAYEHQGGRRGRLVQVSFAGGEIVTRANPPMGMGDPPATAAQKRGAIDQLTALASMLIASNPCRGAIPVFMDGRARFDFIMRQSGQVNYSGSAWRGRAVRCSVQFRPIAGFSDPQEPATLTFLFAALPNGLFAPVRIEMPTDDVGVVTLEARRFSIDRPS
jgi:hypothetical protein